MSKRPITNLRSDSSDTSSNVDVDDEFSEDELEEEPVHRSKSKKVTNALSGFILDEAEVDDNEDDNEDELEEGFSELIAQDRYERDENEDSYSARRRLQHIMDVEEEDKIEEYYRKKYAEIDDRDVIDTSNYAKNEEVKQQSQLPGVKDPRLWRVKCRAGEEQATVIKLMRKSINLRINGDPLQIKSVVCPVGVKECVYIEAYKQSHVKSAIDGIKALNVGKWNQTMVPINEMTDVLKVVSEPMAIKQNCWVRIKRGVYRNDLAQVDFVDHNQNKAILKMIPRVDYKRVKSIYKDKEPAPKMRKRFQGRPSQKLFDLDLVRSFNGEIKKDGDCIVFEGARYRNGFLYKTVAFSGIVTDGDKPTLDELEKFDELPENVDPELMPADKRMNTESVFAAGDVVEVCEGELIHMTGKIISISGDKVSIIPFFADLKNAGALEFPAKELRKIFKVGDHVRVINGKFEGETGHVVNVKDNVAVLLADTTLSEMKVRPRDIQLCSDMNSGVDSQGMYQIGDVVEINENTVGYIIRIEREAVRILTQLGKTTSIRTIGISRKVRSGFALDSQRNFVRQKDIVTVLDSNTQAEIKYVWRHFLFLFNRYKGENGGIFVTNSRNTLLAGAHKTNSDFTGGSTPRLTSPARSPMRSPGPGFGGPKNRDQNKRDKQLIGKTVKVKQGPYKGYVGIVRDATDVTARVELHTVSKTIPVEKSHLMEVASATNGSFTPTTPYMSKTPAYGGALGSATPMYGAHGSRTPMYGTGAQTPTRGDRTPYYGAQTPTHDGNMTPRHGSAWDPNYPNTPARSDDLNDFYDNSPSPAPFSPANPQTPAYGEPMTPGYGLDPSTPETASSVPSPLSPASPYADPSPSPGSDNPVPSPYSSTGSALSPMTPQGGADNWPIVGIEVVMLDNFEEGQYVGQTGYIRAIEGQICSVWLYEEQKEFDCTACQMKPAVPCKQDKVVIISGNRRGIFGQLINIDCDDGIVKTDKAQELRILKLESLAKLSAHHF